MIKLILKPRLNTSDSPEAQRRFTRAIGRFERAPRTVRHEAVRLGGVGGELLTPENARADRRLLYFHGGGYCIGDAATYRGGIGRLAHTSQTPIFAADYRLAPEHPYPAAVDDAERAWNGLMDAGFDAGRVAVAGDSAGGGLALALAMRLRDAGAELPASLTLFCPWTDLTLTGESIVRNRHAEPMLTREWMNLCADYYAADTDRATAEISPLFGDYQGLPPMLIQAGGDDLLLDDARRAHKAAEAAGVDARIDVYADLWHIFQLSPSLVPEGARALVLAGAFIKTRFPD